MSHTIFLCRYRSNGQDFAARISAADKRDAARKMRALDWAPGCGPLGEPEPAPRPAVTRALKMPARHESRLPMLATGGAFLRQFFGTPLRPVGH